MPTEFTTAIISLIAMMFFFVYLGFEIKPRVKDAASVFDMTDVIRLFLITLAFLTGIAILDIGQYSISSNTASMSSMFDNIVSMYTYSMVILIVLVMVYLFFMLPKLVKKIRVDRQKSIEEEV